MANYSTKHSIKRVFMTASATRRQTVFYAVACQFLSLIVYDYTDGDG